MHCIQPRFIPIQRRIGLRVLLRRVDTVRVNNARRITNNVDSGSEMSCFFLNRTITPVVCIVLELTR